MSSPPQTPTTLAAPFQPSPREPTYTTATYKPPSLYPNKKQRTDSLVEASLPYATPSSFSSPGLGPGAFDARIPRRTDDPSFNGSQHAAFAQSRRYSVQPLPTERPRPENAPHLHVNNHYRTPEQTPTSTTFERTFPGQIPQGTVCVAVRDEVGAEHSRAYDRLSHGNGRRASEAYPEGYGHPYDPYHVRQPPHHQPIRLHSDERHYDRRGHHGPQFVHGSPYESNQSAFFMPSHYDYQHGKARKRSNLPKQSTEIMKTWFDQNIGNPYPSEEQKAIFSNVSRPVVEPRGLK
jgi:hypothetical protein